MRSAVRLALLLLAVATSLAAQQPLITPEMHPDSATLHQWLHSEDPRLIAWAADFVRRNHDAALLAELPAFLEQAPMPAQTGERWGYEYRRALLGVLDAVIAERIPVKSWTIGAIEEGFPAHAVVLALESGRETPAADGQRKETFERWLRKSEGGGGNQMLARIAAMEMAQKPTPDLVQRIVIEAELRLKIDVVAPNTGFGSSSDFGCRDNIPLALETGWPQIYTYHLAEHANPTTKLTEYETQLLDLAGDRIVFERAEENGPWGQCSGVAVEPLNAITRHRLLAYWLGVAPRAMEWQPAEEEDITWSTRVAYKRDLATLIEKRSQSLARTVQALRSRGLLPRDDQNQPEPALKLQIACRIKPCPLDRAP